ncbi:MAG TPA: L,D-transpeptidase family protein [Gemmatimonadales bacterium]
MAPGRAGRFLVAGLLLYAARPAEVVSQARDSAEVERLYLLAADSLLWHSPKGLTPAARSAVRLLGNAAEHGLEPSDYGAARLDSLARGPSGPPEARRAFDRLLTTAVVEFLEDLRSGRAPNPSRPGLAPAVREAIAADTLRALASALVPRLAQYELLQETLLRYRRLAADTSLHELPDDRLVRPGEVYYGSPELARLLVALGDLPTGAAARALITYEGPLPGAVSRFQRRHGLVPDSVLGPATFGALNTPLEWRVRQLELAMERLRRLRGNPGERVIVVNVPAFLLFALDSAYGPYPPALTSRVVVGRAVDTRTPGLSGELRYIEFWPYWNVPRSILVREIIPTLRRSPDYLRRNRMELVGREDRATGDSVTPAVLEQLRRGTLRVRQRPGPGNALGLVKFVFPNPEDVYIHATSDPKLFDRPRRDLSHGCIRVEDHAELATWALAGQTDWNADSTRAALAGGRPRRVTLVRPVAVAVFYTTAAIGADSTVYFFEDLYRYDPALDAELRAGAP